MNCVAPAADHTGTIVAGIGVGVAVIGVITAVIALIVSIRALKVARAEHGLAPGSGGGATVVATPPRPG